MRAGNAGVAGKDLFACDELQAGQVLRGRALLTNIDSFRRRHWGLIRLVVGVRNAHRVGVNVLGR